MSNETTGTKGRQEGSEIASESDEGVRRATELSREARMSFPGNPRDSTDSFNHGNRISKAESRKNRERQRLIRRGKEGETVGDSVRRTRKVEAGQKGKQNDEVERSGLVDGKEAINLEVVAARFDSS